MINVILITFQVHMGIQEVELLKVKNKKLFVYDEI